MAGDAPTVGFTASAGLEREVVSFEPIVNAVKTFGTEVKENSIRDKKAADIEQRRQFAIEDNKERLEKLQDEVGGFDDSTKETHRIGTRKQIQNVRKQLDRLKQSNAGNVDLVIKDFRSAGGRAAFKSSALIAAEQEEAAAAADAKVLKDRAEELSGRALTQAELKEFVESGQMQISETQQKNRLERLQDENRFQADPEGAKADVRAEVEHAFTNNARAITTAIANNTDKDQMAARLQTASSNMRASLEDNMKGWSDAEKDVARKDLEDRIGTLQGMASEDGRTRQNALDSAERQKLFDAARLASTNSQTKLNEVLTAQGQLDNATKAVESLDGAVDNLTGLLSATDDLSRRAVSQLGGVEGVTGMVDNMTTLALRAYKGDNPNVPQAGYSDGGDPAQLGKVIGVLTGTDNPDATLVEQAITDFNQATVGLTGAETRTAYVNTIKPMINDPKLKSLIRQNPEIGSKIVNMAAQQGAQNMVNMFGELNEVVVDFDTSELLPTQQDSIEMRHKAVAAPRDALQAAELAFEGLVNSGMATTELDAFIDASETGNGKTALLNATAAELSNITVLANKTGTPPDVARNLKAYVKNAKAYKQAVGTVHLRAALNGDRKSLAKLFRIDPKSSKLSFIPTESAMSHFVNAGQEVLLSDMTATLNNGRHMAGMRASMEDIKTVGDFDSQQEAYQAARLTASGSQL